MVGLAYVVAKMQRGEIHLQRLQGEISAFLGSECATRSEYDDIEEGCHILRFEYRQPPLEIPLLVGEFAYSLRSSLDNLAWQIALLNEPSPSRETAFPIHHDREKGSEKRFRRVTWDMPCGAIEVIKSLQPYNRGDDFSTHPLWRLNKLSNIDKHITIPVNCTFVSFKTGPKGLNGYSTRDLDNGVEVIVDLSIKDDFYIEPSAPELIFGLPTDETGPPFELRFRGFTEIYEFVRDTAIPRFERFFA